MARSFKIICQNCGKEFIANAPNTKYCDDCYEERTCGNCGKIIKVMHFVILFVNYNTNQKKCQNLGIVLFVANMQKKRFYWNRKECEKKDLKFI